MITYVMTICTAGWVMCGQIRYLEQPSLAACQQERTELYRLNGRAAFKYITCQPITPELRKRVEQSQ